MNEKYINPSIKEVINDVDALASRLGVVDEDKIHDSYVIALETRERGSSLLACRHQARQVLTTTTAEEKRIVFRPFEEDYTFNSVTHHNLADTLDVLLRRFRPKERKVIYLRFVKDLDLESCSKAIDPSGKMTRERVRQIESKVLRILRTSDYCKSMLIDFLYD